jgi:acyl carrier protein
VTVSDALELLSRAADIAEYDPDSGFEALHLDSMQVLEWLFMLEDAFDVELNIQQLDFNEFKDHSLNDILGLLRERAANTAAEDSRP